jgi:hypothetical protein
MLFLLTAAMVCLRVQQKRLIFQYSVFMVAFVQALHAWCRNSSSWTVLTIWRRSLFFSASCSGCASERASAYELTYFEVAVHQAIVTASTHGSRYRKTYMDNTNRELQ